MAQQALSLIDQAVSQTKKGKPAKGVFSYLNNIEALCMMKSDVKTVDQFLDIQHLDNCLAIRAAI